MVPDAYREMTINEFAKHEQVNPRTVHRWIAKGAIVCRKTPGGGIRIYDRRNAPRLCDKCSQPLTP